MRTPSELAHTAATEGVFRNAEIRLTLLLFLLSFFGLGLPRIFTSTAAHTLFIETYGSEFIPYAYVVEAFLIPLLGHLYIKADERLSLRWLVAGSMAIDIVVLVGMWAGFSFSSLRPVAFFGMIWFEAEFVLCSLWLWGTATQLMNLRQGKRLFGYVSAGEPLAIIIGGLATPFVLRFLGTKDLLLFSAAAVFIAIGLLLYVTSQFRPQRDGSDESAEEAVQLTAGRPWYADRYVQVLVGIVVISQFGYFFTDTAFYLVASQRFPDEQQLGVFLGKYMAGVGVVSLIVSLFISAPLTRHFGLKGALLLLPAMLTVTAAVGMIAGFSFPETAAIFWMVFMMKTTDQSVRYTVDKTASVTLYQPLPADQRMRVQTALESIIEPLAGGISGLVLAFLLQVLGFGALSIVVAIFIVAIAWTLLVFIQDRYYLKTLRQAMNARRLGAGLITINEPAQIAVISEALDSSAPGRVLNALGLIGKIEGFDRVTCYTRLLAHPSTAVVREVLRQIALLGDGGFDPALIKAQLSRDSEPVLRAAAVQTLVAIDPANTIEHLSPLLEAMEEPVRREAIAGLLRHGKSAATLAAHELLSTALGSESADQRRFAATVLESAKVAGFADELSGLLLDRDPRVRSAALGALDISWTDTLWPHAVDLLCDPEAEVHIAACSAVERGGDAALEPLGRLLGAAEVEFHARHRAARTLGRIGTDAAGLHLQSSLVNPFVKISEAALFALKPVPHKEGLEPTAYIEHQRRILERAHRTKLWQTALSAVPSAEVEPVLQRALAEQLNRDIQSLFHILKLLNPNVDLDSAWDAYRSGDGAQRAISIEVVDTLLRPEVRARALALLEESDEYSAKHGNLQPGVDCIRAVFEASEFLVTPWTRATALYTLLKKGSNISEIDSAQILEPLCAELVLAHQSPADHASRYPAMLTIEKVLILRGTPIFQSVAEEQLVEVAERAEVIELESGVTLFEKGEKGNSLYVVVEGHIKAHIDDRILAVLGPNDVVGDMAALDPEPRSASVTALEPTLLLSISNRNLQLLIDNNPDVARGIIKMLCGRLRHADAAVGTANTESA